MRPGIYGAWVICRQEGGYVNQPGSASSYTYNPLNAQRFPDQASAQAECCGNERPVQLSDLLH